MRSTYLLLLWVVRVVRRCHHLVQQRHIKGLAHVQQLCSCCLHGAHLAAASTLVLVYTSASGSHSPLHAKELQDEVQRVEVALWMQQNCSSERVQGCSTQA
jgi:hypothetical protein